MNLKLANKLKEKNILHKDGKIFGTIRTKGIGDEHIRKNKDLIITELHDDFCMCFPPRDPSMIYRIHYTDIITVGGMEPDRLAKAYELETDGSPMAPRKKPGRKPQPHGI